MKRYIFGIFAIILTFAGKSFAAPLDAYYCFSTQDPQAVVAKFDTYLNSDAAEGLPTVRLWAMLLNGEREETHCVVFENPNGCLLYTSPSPRDLSTSRMPSSA